MTNKEASEEYILAEERKYLGAEIGDMFIEPIKQTRGYEGDKAELLFPRHSTAYAEWIRAALYASLCTWDREPQVPATKLLSASFEEQEKLLLNILKDRPISVALEAQTFVFKLTGVPRSYTHQAVRHRAMAFGQESFRVSSCYSAPIRIPQHLIDNLNTANLESKVGEARQTSSLMKQFEGAVLHCREVYKSLIKSGVPMEQARNIMPMGTETKITITGRLRDYIEVFRDRTGDIAMDEHTYIICLMAQELKQHQPKFFDFINSKVKGLEASMQKYLSKNYEAL